MYRLFPPQSMADNAELPAIPSIPQLRYSYAKLNSMCKKAQLFRHYINRWIDNAHPLSRFLFVLSTSMESEVEVYVGNAASRTDRIARTLGFTTISAMGQWQHLLYNSGIAEAVLIDDEYPLDLANWVENWRDLQPIRVIDHPIEDLALDALDGERVSTQTGIATISINGPMLALQYRQWFKNNQMLYGEDYKAPISMFLYQYPLANALTSHLDIAVRNRFYALMEGRSPTGDNRTTDITEFIGDYSASLDSALGVLARLTNHTSKDWDVLLKGIILPSGYSIYERLELPDWPTIQQVTWALAASRLSTLVFLRGYSARVNSSRNRDDEIKADQDFRRITSAHIYDRLDPDIANFIMRQYTSNKTI